MEIAISEFKAKCMQMIKEVATSDKEWVVTMRGNPVARVVGVKESHNQRVLGGQRDAFDHRISNADIISSDLASDWES